MNYRHIFHAGNFADVMKHALLARILVHLAEKPGAFRVIDTHAGIGLYNLGSDAASRTNEWRDGIGRLEKTKLPPDVASLLQPYLDVALPLLAETPRRYPGSPTIAQKLSRSQDRLIVVEKHPEDFRHLKAATAGDRRISALALDGWTAWNAQVPPPERRGVVLVDPPFEEPGEFERITSGLVQSARKWSSGVVMLWYPVKSAKAVDAFHEALAETGIRKILRCELFVDAIDSEGPLSGTGLIVVNPPWKVKAEAEILLPWMARTLARSSRSSWRVDWITPE